MPSYPSTLARQSESQKTATAHREPWSAMEIELVIETRDIPADEVAETLGRTLYAIEAARFAIDNGVALGGGAAPAKPGSRQRTYTFIGDDVPPGWND